MCETLPKGAIATVSAKRNRTKDHLDPSKDRIRLSDNAMCPHGPRTQRPFVDVQLEIHTQRKLRCDWHEENLGKFGMRARKKLSATVSVPEYVATKRERKTCGLQ